MIIITKITPLDNITEVEEVVITQDSLLINLEEDSEDVVLCMVREMRETEKMIIIIRIRVPTTIIETDIRNFQSLKLVI
jgi:hypothetical protein